MAKRDEQASTQDDALNPHRAEDTQRAATLVASALRQKGVDVSGDEDSDELGTLLEAVERFERAVAFRGGDSMIDTPESDEPDNTEWVVPARNADESLARYASRVHEAADRIAPDDTGMAIDPTRTDPDEV